KLRELLLPMAERAGALVRLDRELKQIASGQPPQKSDSAAPASSSAPDVRRDLPLGMTSNWTPGSPTQAELTARCRGKAFDLPECSPTIAGTLYVQRADGKWWPATVDEAAAVKVRELKQKEAEDVKARQTPEELEAEIAEKMKRSRPDTSKDPL